MSEARMRQRVVKALKPLDAVSVENRVGPGTPDVNYIGGWIELKQMPKWKGDVLLVPHFTPHQRAWLRRRWRRGGAVWVLLQVAQDWLLLRGDVASSLLGKVGRVTLLEQAHAAWLGGLNEEELLECLRRWGEDAASGCRC